MNLKYEKGKLNSGNITFEKKRLYKKNAFLSKQKF